MTDYNLEPEVEAAYTRRGSWDRKFAASIIELQGIRNVMNKYKDDETEMRRQIKKVRKAKKGFINTMRILDIPQEDLVDQIQPIVFDDVTENL